MSCIEYIRKAIEKNTESYKDRLNKEVQAVTVETLEKILKKAEKIA